MIVEYTHDEYCKIILTLGACNIKGGTEAGEISVALSWSTSLRHPCFDDCRSVSIRQEV